MFQDESAILGENIHQVKLQNYEELQYMTRKLIDEYELWGLKSKCKKTKYTPIRDIPKRFTTRRWEGDNKLCKPIYLFGSKNN